MCSRQGLNYNPSVLGVQLFKVETSTAPFLFIMYLISLYLSFSFSSHSLSLTIFLFCPYGVENKISQKGAESHLPL